MPVGNRYHTIQSASESARSNPYVFILMCIAATFLATAAFFCGSLLSGCLDSQTATTESAFALRWQYPLAALLGVELVSMIAATVAAAWFEDAGQAHFDAGATRGDA